MTDRLFDVEPAVGEVWETPQGTRLHIVRVFAHQMYDGQMWVHAAEKKGSFETSIGPVSAFLNRGCKRVK